MRSHALEYDKSQYLRDASRAPAAVLRRLALNIARAHPDTKTSLRRKLLRAGWDSGLPFPTHPPYAIALHLIGGEKVRKLVPVQRFVIFQRLAAEYVIYRRPDGRLGNIGGIAFGQTEGNRCRLQRKWKQKSHGS